MIFTQDLTKSFRLHKKQPGISGAIKSFFNRQYSLNTAVDKFNWQVQPGEFVGLLGPNGAGKTTLMKMLTGIIVPTSGEINVLGYEPFSRDKEFRKKIALVMGQKSQLWWDIPAMDSFLLLQKYYEIPEKNFYDRLNNLAELLDVKKLLDVHVRKLSLGERMKMELMSSLLHQPEVIFLDEPTIGLDLVAQNNIRNFLREYHKQHNTTVILTSHYMADVEALCKRIVLILGGKKRFDGSIHEFEDILGKEKFVTFYFNEPVLNNQNLWQQYEPQWNKRKTRVELRIAEEELREVSGQILNNFDVSDFATEKMPIERVMQTLMTKPELIKVDNGAQ